MCACEWRPDEGVGHPPITFPVVRQGLSLNLEFVFSHLGWKPALELELQAGMGCPWFYTASAYNKSAHSHQVFSLASIVHLK